MCCKCKQWIEIKHGDSAKKTKESLLPSSVPVSVHNQAGAMSQWMQALEFGSRSESAWLPDLWLSSKSVTEAKTKALFHILDSIFLNCGQFFRILVPNVKPLGW